MPTLLIENLPAPLLDRIVRLAEERKCTPAEAAIQHLEIVLSEPPIRNVPFLTPEISAPFSLPRPKGEIVDPSQIIDVSPPLPTPHDLPDEE